MNEFLNFVFGIGGSGEALGFGTPDAQPGFVHQLPAWLIVLVLILIVTVAFWSYRALPGKASVRLVLAGIRAAVLSILFLIALGPRIEQTIIETEPDWVLVLIDRSGSLEIPRIGRAIARSCRRWIRSMGSRRDALR